LNIYLIGQVTVTLVFSPNGKNCIKMKFITQLHEFVTLVQSKLFRSQTCNLATGT